MHGIVGRRMILAVARGEMILGQPRWLVRVAGVYSSSSRPGGVVVDSASDPVTDTSGSSLTPAGGMPSSGAARIPNELASEG